MNAEPIIAIVDARNEPTADDTIVTDEKLIVGVIYKKACERIHREQTSTRDFCDAGRLILKILDQKAGGEKKPPTSGVPDETFAEIEAKKKI